MDTEYTVDLARLEAKWTEDDHIREEKIKATDNFLNTVMRMVLGICLTLLFVVHFNK